jgi:CTP synthase
MARKISLFCNVRPEAVIEERDVDFSIYQVPLMLVQARLDRIVVEHLRLPKEPRTDLSDWEAMLEEMRSAKKTVEIAIVGKYIELHDAYKSIYESLAHAGTANRARVNVRKIRAEEVLDRGVDLLEGVHGLLVPGGFGERGIEGKIAAVRWAREHGVPFFGICLGLQCAVIEFARNVAHLEDAHTLEYTPHTPHPVIHLMSSQEGVSDKGGTMRLGAYDCRIEPGTLAHRLYGTLEISERHRHRFEFNNDYRETLRAAGLVPSGTHPALDLVEIIEIPSHPFFVGVQFHPEFQSSPLAPHPIFRGFVAAAVQKARQDGERRPQATSV